MKYTKRFFVMPVLGLLIIIASSCIGVRADILLRSDGSGTIELEHHLSRLLESLGKLDGNERWPTIPIGRADFERTVARVEGLTLRSFSSKNNGKDIINMVKLDFSSIEALIHFLDAAGQRASLSQENGIHRLFLTLTSGSENLDPDLLALFTAISQGYSISLSFTTPVQGIMTLYDTKRNPLRDTPGIKILPKGKKVFFMSSWEDILALRGGVGIELIWE